MRHLILGKFALENLYYSTLPRTKGLEADRLGERQLKRLTRLKHRHGLLEAQPLINAIGHQAPGRTIPGCETHVIPVPDSKSGEEETGRIPNPAG